MNGKTGSGHVKWVIMEKQFTKCMENLYKCTYNSYFKVY